MPLSCSWFQQILAHFDLMNKTMPLYLSDLIVFSPIDFQRKLCHRLHEGLRSGKKTLARHIHPSVTLKGSLFEWPFQLLSPRLPVAFWNHGKELRIGIPAGAFKNGLVINRLSVVIRALLQVAQ